jgi:hypothetical protein
VLFFEWRMLSRRWYAVLIGLLLTAGLAGLTTVLVPMSYTAEAQILLLPPKPAEGPGNPYIDLGGLNGVGDAVGRALNDATTLEALRRSGASAEFTVEPDTLAAAPILLISATDPNPDDAVKTMRALIQQVPIRLQQMQVSQGIAASAQITSTVLSQSAKAEAQFKSQLRALLVAIAGGLTMTWLGTALLDAWLRRRQNNQPGAPTKPRAPSPAPAAGPIPGTMVVPDFSRVITGTASGQRVASVPPSPIAPVAPVTPTPAASPRLSPSPLPHPVPHAPAPAPASSSRLSTPDSTTASAPRPSTPSPSPAPAVRPSAQPPAPAPAPRPSTPAPAPAPRPSTPDSTTAPAPASSSRLSTPDSTTAPAPRPSTPSPAGRPTSPTVSPARTPSAASSTPPPRTPGTESPSPSATTPGRGAEQQKNTPAGNPAPSRNTPPPPTTPIPVPTFDNESRNAPGKATPSGRAPDPASDTTRPKSSTPRDE